MVLTRPSPDRAMILALTGSKNRPEVEKYCEQRVDRVRRREPNGTTAAIGTIAASEAACVRAARTQPDGQQRHHDDAAPCPAVRWRVRLIPPPGLPILIA